MALTADTSPRPPRIALIGAGGWAARYHVPVLLRLARRRRVVLQGLWNRTRSKAEALAHRHGINRVYASLDELLADESLDAVSVVVGSGAVLETVLRINARGLPVICEKPPGRDAAEARTLAEQVRLPNVVGFNRRYSPLCQRFKEALGGLPPIRFVECRFLRRGRTTPRFVSETGIHGIDLLDYLFGPLRSVRTLAVPAGRESDKFRVAEVELAQDIRGIVELFPLSGIARERIEAHGEGVCAVLAPAQHFCDESRGEITVYRDTGGRRPVVQRIREPLIRDPPVQGGYLGEYEDLLRALRGGGTTLSSFQSAARSMAAAETVESRGGMRL